MDGNGDVVDVTGEPVTTIVVDNGNNAQDPADQIGFSNVGDATPCTDPDPGYELFDVPQGQVKVN